MKSSRGDLVRKGVSFSFSKFCTFCERWIESRLGMEIPTKNHVVFSSSSLHHG